MFEVRDVPARCGAFCHVRRRQEIYDWIDDDDQQSTPILLTPGSVVSATLVSAQLLPRRCLSHRAPAFQTYVKSLNGYAMNMSASTTSATSNFQYSLLPAQKETESVAYFVLEHQPDSCDELPAMGIVTWTDIRVEVNGLAVPNPTWTAAQEAPACGSQAAVINATAVSITWQSSSA